MSDVDLSAPPTVRVGAFVLVAVLHVLAILALIRAFAPDFAARAVHTVVATFTVTITAPSPAPTPTPAPAPKAGAAGALGEAGRHAVPRAVMAPKPRVNVPHVAVAPPAVSTGTANSSGARDAGSGPGAGGQGSGTGSGGSGTGQGGGGTRPVKIAGDINSARDYPIASRDLRIGDYVVIWLTVGTDGRPTGCRVGRGSRDAQADAITCRLASERFRFKPATGSDGQPVVATFGWQQRWYYRN